MYKEFVICLLQQLQHWAPWFIFVMFVQYESSELAVNIYRCIYSNGKSVDYWWLDIVLLVVCTRESCDSWSASLWPSFCSFPHWGHFITKITALRTGGEWFIFVIIAILELRPYKQQFIIVAPTQREICWVLVAQSCAFVFLYQGFLC